MQIEILSVQQFPATDLKRLGQFDSLIVYRIDAKRSNSLTVPKNPVSKDEIEKAIVEQQKAIAPLIGHKFEIK